MPHSEQGPNVFPSVTDDPNNSTNLHNLHNYYNTTSTTSASHDFASSHDSFPLRPQTLQHSRSHDPVTTSHAYRRESDGAVSLPTTSSRRKGSRSTTVLQPRDERNQTPWLPSPSPHKVAFENLGLRDSLADDPFFRSYNSPHIQGITHDWQANLAKSHVERRQWVNPEKPVRAASIAEEHHSEMSDINLCIAASDVGGASSHVLEALGLLSSQKEVSAADNKRKFVVDGTSHVVNVFDGSKLDVQITNGELPRVDGVISFYATSSRVTQPPKLSTSSARLMSTLDQAALPNLIVSLKPGSEENLLSSYSVYTHEQARLMVDGLEVFQATVGSVDCARQCVSMLLQHILYDRFEHEPDEHKDFQRQTQSSSARSPVTPALRSQPHSRVTSEVTASAIKPIASHGDIMSLIRETKKLASPRLAQSKSSRSLENYNKSRPLRKNSTNFSSNGTEPLVYQNSTNPDTINENTCHSPDSSFQTKSSFKSSSKASVDSSEPTTSSETDIPEPVDPSEDVVSLHYLVDQLVVNPHAKGHTQFKHNFLVMFRLFAAPVEILEALTDRYYLAGEGDYPRSLEIRERVLAVLNQWLGSYPGDFGHNLTRTRLNSFINTIPKESPQFRAAESVRIALDLVAPNDDTEWSHCDNDIARPATAGTFFSTSSADTEEDFDSSSPESSFGTFGFSNNDIDSRLALTNTSSSGTKAQTPTGLEFRNPSYSGLNVSAFLQREASFLSPQPRDPLTKIRWRQVMEYPDAEIAKELTRIDSIMFTSFLPRDMVRHALVPCHNRLRFPGLSNVSRMIDHFNHIAAWVTNLVLFRDKPKHRALMLEKLMRVARKLRELNNYNSLGAVVAGIHGTSIHRLSATRDMVPVDMQRDFMKLEILMSTQKGHSAYRLAWDNTPGDRIPFVALHRRDLILAGTGNKTLIRGSAAGDLAAGAEQRQINWKNVEIMGEVLHGIEKAQAKCHAGLVPNEEVKALVLGCAITKDEDDLYARSVSLEPGPGAVGGRGSVGAESGAAGQMISSAEGLVKRKLSWLQKYGVGERM